MMCPKTVGLSRGYAFKKYQLIRQIGYGSFGRVYYSSDKQAVKVINVRTLEPETRKYLVNQIQSLRSIKHVNVVQMLDQFSQDGYQFIVMQYCQSDLKKHIYTNNLNQKEAMKIFNQILQGYKELLKIEIAHRDLKPANILMSKNVPKIADFGFSKKYDTLKSNAGTPHYQAPEAQFKQDYQFYTNKCDIWSLGIILYQMIYKTVPFKLISKIDIFKKQIQFTKVNISNQVKDLILQMLKVDPNQRIDWDQLFYKVENLVNSMQNQGNQKGIIPNYNEQKIQVKKYPIQFLKNSPKKVDLKNFACKNNQNYHNNITNENLTQKQQSPLRNQNQNQGSPLKHSPNRYFPMNKQSPQKSYNNYINNQNPSPGKYNQNYIQNKNSIPKSPSFLYRPESQPQIKPLSPQKFQRTLNNSPYRSKQNSPRKSFQKNYCLTYPQQNIPNQSILNQYQPSQYQYQNQNQEYQYQYQNQPKTQRQYQVQLQPQYQYQFQIPYQNQNLNLNQQYYIQPQPQPQQQPQHKYQYQYENPTQNPYPYQQRPQSPLKRNTSQQRIGNFPDKDRINTNKLYYQGQHRLIPNIPKSHLYSKPNHSPSPSRRRVNSESKEVNYNPNPNPKNIIYLRDKFSGVIENLAGKQIAQKMKYKYFHEMNACQKIWFQSILPSFNVEHQKDIKRIFRYF